jgi:hypothetical protein
MEIDSVLKERPVVYSLALLIIGFLIGSFIVMNIRPTGFAILSPQDVAGKVLSYINNNLVQPGSSASFVSIEEVSGVYKIITEYRGNKIPVYATKDGSFLFISQPINLSQELPKRTQQKTETKKTSCEDLSKSDKPQLEAFVVSYCPFGLQMQRILSEIVKEIPELKDYIKVRYMGSIREGKIQQCMVNAKHRKT